MSKSGLRFKQPFILCDRVEDERGIMQLAKHMDGKKFMWDGTEYLQEAEGISKMEKYTKDGFETRMIKDGGKFYLFTRRGVAEAKVGS